jgi:hypothetical protein
MLSMLKNPAIIAKDTTGATHIDSLTGLAATAAVLVPERVLPLTVEQ